MQNKFSKFASEEHQVSEGRVPPTAAQDQSGSTEINGNQIPIKYTHVQIPPNQNMESFEIDDLIFDPPYLGKMKVCCYRNHNPLITIGPHWPFTLCLLIFISVFFFAILGTSLTHFNFILTAGSMFVYLTYLTIFAGTALKNPGIPDRNRRLSDNEYYERCIECDMIKDKRRKPYHCDDCMVCVEDYDHHCPWTSKCIGGGNIRWFSVFLVSTALVIVYAIVMGVTGIAPKG